MIRTSSPWLAVSDPQEGAGLGDMIMGHAVDAHKIELPGLTWYLPQWDPVRLGPLVVNFSPTKHGVFVLVTAILVAAIMLWTAYVSSRRGPERAQHGFSNMIEAIVLFLRDAVAMPNIGHGGERYVPLIVTLFFFIWISNMLGLLPWGASPTANLSVTAALALIAFFAIETAGLRTLGWRGYSRTVFFWPQGMALPLKVMMFIIMTPVEILSKFTKPFALAIRLFANMAAGKFVILALIGLVFLAAPVAGFVLPWLAPVLMAVAIMVLKLFVAILQAYIFAMLTSVFIGLIRHAH
jgi:F-type H+-transporting ATPase subunit a